MKKKKKNEQAESDSVRSMRLAIHNANKASSKSQGHNLPLDNSLRDICPLRNL